MNQNQHEADNARDEHKLERRTIVSGAAWSIPVLAAAVSTPLAAASGDPEPAPEYGFESNFGSGWYPNVVNTTSSGVFQFDSDSGNKYHRVTGTVAGDVVTGIYVEFAVSANHPQVNFYALAGSNPDWTVPTFVRQEGGVRIYRFDYLKSVVATGATTDIPIGFYYRAATPFYSGVTVQTSRYATVNSTPLVLVRNPSNYVNTNVPVSSAPRP